MINCARCGGKRREGQVFCTKCGTKLTEPVRPPDSPDASGGLIAAGRPTNRKKPGVALAVSAIGVGVVAVLLVVVRPFEDKTLTVITAVPARRIEAAAMHNDASLVSRRLRSFGIKNSSARLDGDRMRIRLRGRLDPEMAAVLVGGRGELQFRLVEDERLTYEALKTVDQKGMLLSSVRTIGGDFGVDDRDYSHLKMLLPRAMSLGPDVYEFQFGPSEAVEGSPVRRLYMLKAKPEMLGPALEDVRSAPYQGSEPGFTNTWIVSFKLARKDAAVFAQVTGRNIGRRLAIVLDSTVKSAPVIQTRIPDGNVMITTNSFDQGKAMAIAAVLRTGPLSTAWQVEEIEQTPPHR